HVEAFEQGLGGLAGDAEQIAEACERDASRALALLHQHAAGMFVSGGRDRVAIAHAHEAALLFEKAPQPRVFDLHRLEPESCFELGGFSFALSERARRSRSI